MTEVRRAVADHARELVRLRGLMLAAMNGFEPEPRRWQDIAVETLRKRLADPDGPLAAFVIDKPDRPGGFVDALSSVSGPTVRCSARGRH